MDFDNGWVRVDVHVLQSSLRDIMWTTQDELMSGDRITTYRNPKNELLAKVIRHGCCRFEYYLRREHFPNVRPI